MLLFPNMLFSAAEQAGIPHPENDEYDPDEYPRFHLFCCAQLSKSMRAGEHFENAKIIAQVPEDQIRTITPRQLEEMGFCL